MDLLYCSLNNIKGDDNFKVNILSINWYKKHINVEYTEYYSITEISVNNVKYIIKSENFFKEFTSHTVMYTSNINIIINIFSFPFDFKTDTSTTKYSDLEAVYKIIVNIKDPHSKYKNIYTTTEFYGNLIYNLTGTNSVK